MESFWSTMPFVGQTEGKGVYGRYHSVSSNFANLNPYTGGNATISVCVGDYIPTCAIYSVHVEYIIAWRGLAALLILREGQCEGLNVGMGESRNSHAFFVSIHLKQITNAEFGG